MDKRRAGLDGVERVPDRGQFLVVDADKSQGRLGARGAFGRYRHDRFAHVAHPPPGERRHVLHLNADKSGREIGGGQDRADSPKIARRRDVYSSDPGVGERAPKKLAPERAGNGNIRCVKSSAGDLIYALDPGQGFAYGPIRHAMPALSVLSSRRKTQGALVQRTQTEPFWAHSLCGYFSCKSFPAGPMD